MASSSQPQFLNCTNGRYSSCFTKTDLGKKKEKKVLKKKTNQNKTKRANPADVQYTGGGIYTQLWRALLESQEVPPRSLGAAVRDSSAPSGRSREGGGTAGPCSVQEALAGFFPPAGCAPLVPVLDAVHLTALLGFTTNFPAKGQRNRKCTQYCKLSEICVSATP